MIAAVTLCTVFLLFACNNDDFYHLYGEPQTLSEGEKAGETQAPITENDTQDPSDLTEQEEQTDKGSQDTDSGTEQPTDGTDNDNKTTDLSDEKEKDKDTENADQTGEDDRNDDLLKEDEIVLSEHFDLSETKEGLYPYIAFRPSETALTVFVGMRSVGTAEVGSDGGISFDCGFAEQEYRLWGNLDQRGHLTTYVWFEALNAFKQVAFVSSAMQIDLTEQELTVLQNPSPSSDLQESDEEGVIEETQKTGVTNGTSLADLSPLTQSALYPLWEGIHGVAENLTVDMLGEMGEEYRFSVVGMTAEESAALVARFESYITYRAEIASGTEYEAAGLYEGSVFNLAVRISKENAVYSADIHATVYPLGEE